MFLSVVSSFLDDFDMKSDAMEVFMASTEFGHVLFCLEHEELAAPWRHTGEGG